MLLVQNMRHEVLLFKPTLVQNLMVECETFNTNAFQCGEAPLATLNLTPSHFFFLQRWPPPWPFLKNGGRRRPGTSQSCALDEATKQKMVMGATLLGRRKGDVAGVSSGGRARSRGGRDAATGSGRASTACLLPMELTVKRA